MIQQENGLWHKTKKVAGNLWADTKNLTTEVWEDTKNVTEDVWDGTKNVAGKVKNKFAHDDDEDSMFFYEETDYSTEDCECPATCKKEKELRSAQRAARSH